jgi:divalent anion:Na+ symporter, DASS family
VTAPESVTVAAPVKVPDSRRRTLLARAATFALALGIWIVPIPAGLTSQAWHLFAIFAAAILSVILAAFPLLTAAMLAAAAAVLTGTITPAKAFAGFANGSVLLVVVAFLVASSVVKSGLGRRISFLVVSAFGRSTLGLAYSIFLTDAAIAPAFPSNTARSGVLFPIVLSLAQGAGSKPDDANTRRLGGYLMFCGMASLAVSSALWLTATSVNPIGVEIARQFGLKITFGSWLLAASVPAIAAVLLLPLVLYWVFPPGVRGTPNAPAAARAALRSMGPLSRDEKVVAVAFALMVTGWVTAGTLKLDLTAVAFAGLGALLATSVLTLDDIKREGGTLETYLWLAVLFAMSGQLNELGFMSYVGGRLSSALEGVPWPAAYVALLVLYVLMHYLFVSQSSQVLALFGVFVEVGLRSGVPAPLMAFALLFASSYFSTITPQGGSQNVIFVGAGYLTQGELYRLGALTTAFCLLVFLVLGTPWLYMIVR